MFIAKAASINDFEKYFGSNCRRNFIMERVGHLNNSQQLLSQLVKFKALKAIREACGGESWEVVSERES